MVEQEVTVKNIFVPYHSTDARAHFFSLHIVELWNSLLKEVALHESTELSASLNFSLVFISEFY